MSFQDLHDCLSSFDPAIHLHSESEEVARVDASYSDDIEALNVPKEELRADNSRNGIAVQHRAWQIPEIFRSEDSDLLGTVPSSISHARCS